MPTYPYACTACDHRFEQVQAFSDPSLTECPVCGGRLRKVFSSVGIVFKGSGFYRNDARAGSGSSEKSSSSETSSEKSTADASSGASTSSGDSAGKSSSDAGSSSTSTTSPSAAKSA
ncbi:FmdB family zinc ribbon protein [Actinomycetospora straminea]|uniref:Putative regulatory protein FmdB zinc ribbon domain-containing protein n=1 Tax=Actinomycetospora straminea TaxID=663607 RepID=A0ABP9F7Y0_9PSEU|nr:FmdB family zinc ribbon protein [Actinomycetospora straminea]MDD7936235.1 zinc ribbon domain-containing protein [Actinomycetospora straminea]